MNFYDLPGRLQNDCVLDFVDDISKYDWNVEEIDTKAIFLAPLFSIERTDLIENSKKEWISWFLEELKNEYQENIDLFSSSEQDFLPNERCHSLLSWYPYCNDTNNRLNAEDITIVILADGTPWIIDGHHRLTLCLVKNIEKINVIVGREIRK